MERAVPLWLVLLLLFWGLIGTVAFGWVVQSRLSGGERTGVVGDVSVEVASFPSTAAIALRDLRRYITGTYRDASVRTPREVDLDGFVPVPAADHIGVDGLMMRADRAALEPGWRILVGAFSFGDTVQNAALLLSADLEVVHAWILEEIPLGGETPRASYRKFVHGVEFLADGSLVFTFDGSISLQRIGVCGERLWAVPGEFHHAVSATDDGRSVWSLREDSLIQIAVDDGRVLREFTMEDVIRANPDIDVLGIRRVHESMLGQNARNTDGRWLEDPFHLNDVEPLPLALAAAFPDFDRGDLLVSARSLNLVFVVDPETLEIKWWRVGATQRQHDPDWQPGGVVSVFDNRMSRDSSRIVGIDVDSMETTTIFDGRDMDVYTRIRGKHQITPDGRLLLTSSQQGRVLEIDEGDVTLEMQNTKPGSDSLNYVLSDLMWLPPDALSCKEIQCFG